MKNQVLAVAKGAGIAAVGALIAITLINRLKMVESLTGRV